VHTKDEAGPPHKKERPMEARSRTQGGEWARWSGGGALMLALLGLFAPATTSAVIYQDNTPEVIEVEGEAPWNPSMGIGGHPSGVPTNGTPSGGDSGGGSGGGSVPSGGGATVDTPQKRLANAKQDCLVLEGVWSAAVFNDYDSHIQYSGYSCRLKWGNSQYKWSYYDSLGYLNQTCIGNLDVQTCDPA
jgi:hypothetical protein